MGRKNAKIEKRGKTRVLNGVTKYSLGVAYEVNLGLRLVLDL